MEPDRPEEGLIESYKNPFTGNSESRSAIPEGAPEELLRRLDELSTDPGFGNQHQDVWPLVGTLSTGMRSFRHSAWRCRSSRNAMTRHMGNWD